MRSLWILSWLVVVSAALTANSAFGEATIARGGSVGSCKATGLSMKYEAFIAGVNAGEANLLLTQEGARYRVEGTARSKGLWESIQQWRAEYSIDGELLPSVPESGEQHALPTPGHFYTLQTTPSKRREIHIEGGVLKETKNRKVRDPRPAHTGYDLLSALFFLPTCHAAARVHTGRDGYEFTRLERAADQRADQNADAQDCNYAVVDEDGERYRLALTYQQFGNVRVPATIAVGGPLPGRMVLVESSPLKPAPECL